MNKKADIIFYNGAIHTQDAVCPFAQAVAIAGNRIVAVGGDSDILPLTGPGTNTIDLENRLVLPGFIDSHIHFYDIALGYDNIDFSQAWNFGEMEAAIVLKTRQIPKGQWILGHGLNESEWPENRMPDRYDLDRVAPEHPLCIWRCDLHIAIANSLALKLTGIGSDTPDPPGGVIVRDANGAPTGALRELAANLIKEAVPPHSEETILRNMQQAIKDVHALGMTGIHDIRLMGGRDGEQALTAWRKLHAQKQLDIRCHVTAPGEMTDWAIAEGLRTGDGDDRLRIGHLKFFADGGMGARTAWMKEPYLDAEYGMPLTPVKELEDAIRKAAPAGLSAMVHSIGTRSNQEIIEMFARLEAEGVSAPGISHRIEHLQMIEPEELRKLGQLKTVVASCQPNNLSLDISMIDSCVGEKGKHCYALKSILETGRPLMLNSDAPVCALSPLTGIYSAVTRKRMNRTPEEGWYPEQRLTVAEAVKGYTLTPALVSGVGDRLGSLTPGKLADIIILNRNIFTIDADEIADVHIDMTIFDGKIEYRSD